MQLPLVSYFMEATFIIVFLFSKKMLLNRGWSLQEKVCHWFYAMVIYYVVSPVTFAIMKNSLLLKATLSLPFYY